MRTKVCVSLEKHCLKHKNTFINESKYNNNLSQSEYFLDVEQNLEIKLIMLTLRVAQKS